MSRIRNSRTRLLTAAATVAIAAFSLTACGEDGSGVRSEGASSSSASSSQEDAKTNATGSKSDTDVSSESGKRSQTGGSDSGDSGDSGASATKDTKDADDAEGVTCQGSNTKTVAAPLNRPVNHMLLTVTNTGSSNCYLYNYPAVQFGEAQSVPPVIEDSKPQAVVTLAPGESGYASVNLSAADGSGTNGHTVKSLTVYFQGRTADEDVPSAAHPSLPAKGVYVDDSLKVTYWQQSMDDAISW
ncbi:DUF4232 domain-containing protein [Streptomyces luomodiensis]|uniref:DUF4232 domain-containing protein n=1 Tax=Streptomyces luomodiensis TaxID=3026192 RepID=A0ABY9V5I2_9ACTN|nr:DUF4232 domain-containing protein [Streptomyces sp. SCA4-21]WNE97990.1 DUF4232 domain-containing protein [Streptomyces sp. SCA4-21]